MNPTIKKGLKALILKIGWFELFNVLLEIAGEQKDSELSREIETIMYNHTPEVR